MTNSTDHLNAELLHTIADICLASYYDGDLTFTWEQTLDHILDLENELESTSDYLCDDYADQFPTWEDLADATFACLSYLRHAGVDEAYRLAYPRR